MNSEAKIRVWDPFVRVFHWSLVSFFFIAYVSGESESLVHIYSGYVVIALVSSRLIWGVIGTKYARFRQFAYPPAKLLEYLKQFAGGRPQHYTGHNPAAAWMIFALLLCVLLTSFTGLKLYGVMGYGPLAATPGGVPAVVSDFSLIPDAAAKDLDRKAYRDFYRRRGDRHENRLHEIWEEVHEFFANLTVLLVIIHVAGAVVASMVHGENLIKAMFTGVKTAHPDSEAE